MRADEAIYMRSAGGKEALGADIKKDERGDDGGR